MIEKNLNQRTNELLTIIEVTLLNEIFPDYIEVSFQQNFIYILISKEDFKFQTLSDRILGVFELLKFYCPEILEEFPFIIETFDSQELDQLMEMYL